MKKILKKSFDVHGFSTLRLNNFNKILLLCLLLLVWLFPSLFLSSIKYINVFFWSQLSSVSLALSKGYLTIIYPEQPAYELITYSISIISGISALQLAYFPIGAIIVPICYFTISKKVLKSNGLAILLTTYVTYDFTIYPGQFNTFAYVWTRTLFLSFLLLYILYLQSNDGRYVLIILPIFLTTYYLHPTYMFWMTLFAIFINIFVILAKKLNLNKVTFKSTVSLALIFIITYFGFNQYFYNTLLRTVISTEPNMISHEFISTIKSFLGMTTPSIEKYALAITPPTQMIGYATFIRTLIILISLLITLLWWFKNNHKKLSSEVDNDIILIATLFLVGVGHILAYAVRGHMSLRFTTFIYPIVSIYFLQKVKVRKPILSFLLFSLVFLAFLQTGSFIAENYNNSDNIVYDSIKPSSSWLIGKIQNEPIILSDFDTSQIFYFYFKSENRSFAQRLYDSELYGLIANSTYILNKNEKLKNICSYFIVNKESDTRFTRSAGWKHYEPLSNYICEINNNVNINMIYDDDKVWIFKTR